MLGATGSIGASTIDLIKRDRGALSRRGASPRTATPPRWRRWRASSARASRRLAIPPPIASSRTALAGTGIEAGAGRERAGRGRATAGRLGDRRDHRRGRPQADAGGRRARRASSRSPTRRCLVCAGGLFMRRAAARGRHRAAGRFRAQRAVPGDERRPPRGRAPRHPDRLGRSVPDLERRGDPRGHARTGAQASELVDGAEGHDQFGDPDEQGARSHRGASSVCAPARRRSTSSSIRSRSCTAWSNSATARSSRSSAARTCGSRSRTAWPGRSASRGRRRGSISRVRRTLTFEDPDFDPVSRRWSLRAGRWRRGGAAPTVLNAANEVAVAEFLARRLGFVGISALVEATLDAAL